MVKEPRSSLSLLCDDWPWPSLHWLLRPISSVQKSVTIFPLHNRTTQIRCPYLSSPITPTHAVAHTRKHHRIEDMCINSGRSRPLSIYIRRHASIIPTIRAPKQDQDKTRPYRKGKHYSRHSAIIPHPPRSSTPPRRVNTLLSPAAHSVARN